MVPAFSPNRQSSASTTMDDTLPPNPPPLRHPSGEVRRRPRKQSWEGPVSLEQAQADYDLDENTPDREASRAARRLALVALKTDSIPLCRHFTRGEPCKTRLCKQRHETNSVAEDLTVSRATSQRLASLAMKSTEKEVKYIVDDPAANAALAAQRAVQMGGHGAAALRADLRLGHKLWCDPCSRGFDKSKQYEQHVAGKKHVLAVESSARYLAEFKRSRWYDPAVSASTVTSAWSLDAFMDGLPRRSRSSSRASLTLNAASEEGRMDPGMTVSGLSPNKRGQLWRYLRDLMPDHELPGVVAQVEAASPRFLRLKELLESTEAYRHVVRALEATPHRGAPSTIYDLACGHGLVGLLVAYSHPDIALVSIDRERRPAFEAWSAAMQRVRGHCDVSDASGDVASAGDVRSDSDASGDVASSASGAEGCVECHPGTAPATLGNATFIQGDFQQISLIEKLSRSPSLVLCVHGCKEVNRDAVRLARSASAAWLVIPCCLQVKLYLETASFNLPDDLRYALLCGAMAANYEATSISAIDRRITNRAIVLGGHGMNAGVLLAGGD